MTIRPILTGLAALFAASLALAAPSFAQAPDSAATDEHAPTTAVPWNPPRAVWAREPWEMAVNGPARLATLPVSVLGLVVRNTMLVMEENSVVPKALFVVSAPIRYGFYVMPASLGDRTGMGGEVRYMPTIARELIEAGVSGSTGKYSRFHAGIGPALARIEYTDEWRPHDRLFGIGLETSEDDASSYSTSSQTLRLSTLIGFARPRPGATPRHTLAASAAHRERVVGASQGDPDDRRFDPLTSPVGSTLDRESKGTLYGMAVQTDQRSGAPHWSRGFRVRLGADHFEPESEGATVMPFVGLPPPRFAKFQRYTLEAEAGISFYRDPRTLRLGVQVTDTEPNDDEGGTLIGIPDLARLGGSEGLAGFEPGRFHDLDAAVVRLSYIFPLAQHYEVDLHVEGGGVYQDLQHHAKLAEIETSYGVLLRPRTKFAPIGAFGVEWCREGMRFRFSFGAVE